MKKSLLIVLALAGLAFSQSSTPIRYPDSKFTSPWVMEPQALPTSPTTIVTGNSIVDGGWIWCGSARNITLTDGNSVSAGPFPVSANQVVSVLVFAKAYFPTSLSISADGSGCNYSIWGRR